jgi:uncharacterized protein YigA (DUF484 family)
MTDTTLDDGIKAGTVAAYLRRHPQFLADYPELALSLSLPREQGPAASLAVYQLQNLREKNADLERRLAELVEIAGENETLMSRVHALTLALLSADTVDATVRGVVERLGEDFHSESVRLMFYGDQHGLPEASWLLREDKGAAGLPEFSEFLAQQEPLSGRLAGPKLKRLFGEDAEQIRSAALMRLGDEGLLAIGSGDPDRFQPGMGTLFLKMISATISTALERARGKAA